jgi:hypothetical protein
MEVKKNNPDKTENINSSEKDSIETSINNDKTKRKIDSEEKQSDHKDTSIKETKADETNASTGTGTSGTEGGRGGGKSDNVHAASLDNSSSRVIVSTSTARLCKVDISTDRHKDKGTISKSVEEVTSRPSTSADSTRSLTSEYSRTRYEINKKKVKASSMSDKELRKQLRLKKKKKKRRKKGSKLA